MDEKRIASSVPVEPGFLDEYPRDEYFRGRTGISAAKVAELGLNAEVQKYQVYIKKVDISRISYDGIPVEPEGPAPNGYGLTWDRLFDEVYATIATKPNRNRGKNKDGQYIGNLQIFDDPESFDEDGFLTETAHRRLQNEMDNWIKPIAGTNKAEKLEMAVKAKLLHDMNWTEEDYQKQMQKAKKVRAKENNT